MTRQSNSARTWITIAALLGAFAVLAGAFGAHGLKAILDTQQLKTWNTASSYQLVHAVLLLALAVSTVIDQKLVRIAYCLLLTGVLLFSGSLFILLLTGVNTVALLTPVGGILLVVGWLTLALAALRM